MRNAPPVQVPVGRFVWGRRLPLVLALASAALLLGAWQASARDRDLLVGGMVLWLLCALGSWRLLAQDILPPGELAWDGQDWCFRWSEGGARGVDPLEIQVQVHVIWDLGSAMLVRVRTCSPGPQDLPWRGQGYTVLSAARMPALWHGCRCAVHGHDIL